MNIHRIEILMKVRMYLGIEWIINIKQVKKKIMNNKQDIFDILSEFSDIESKLL